MSIAARKAKFLGRTGLRCFKDGCLHKMSLLPSLLFLHRDPKADRDYRQRLQRCVFYG